MDKHLFVLFRRLGIILSKRACDRRVFFVKLLSRLYVEPNFLILVEAKSTILMYVKASWISSRTVS